MSESSTSWTNLFQYAVISDVGMRRMNNQDSYLLVPAPDEATWRARGHLFVVADGMGAHAAGELASKLAVEGVTHHYRKQRQLSPPEAILRALRETNSDIHQRGQANAEFRNMGTTCSALLLLPQGAVVAHVGDSRVYRIRGKTTEQVTFDHSLLWELQAASASAGQKVPLNVPKHVITRSLGPQATVQVDLEGPLDVEPGDVFLVCSDGLTGKVSDQELGMIASVLAPDAAAQLLVDLANVRGGPDNITVVVIRANEGVRDRRIWRGEPLVVGQELRPPPRVHNTIWAVLVLGLVLACGLAILQFYLPAVVAAAAGLAALAAAAWQLYGTPTEGGVALTSGRQLGKAPYVRADSKPSLLLLQQLADSVHDALHWDELAGWDERERAMACLTEAELKRNAGDLSGSLQMLGVALRLVARKFRE